MRKLREGIAATVLALYSLIGIEMLSGSLTCVEAYAKNIEDKPYLKDIYVGLGYDIEFIKHKYEYIVDVDKDVEDIYVKTRPENENDIIKINGKVITKDDKFKKDLNLEMGKNKVVIEVIKNNDNNEEEYTDNDDDFSDDDVQNDKDKYGSAQDKTVYTLYIYRGGADEVYLKNITLDKSNIGYFVNKKNYNIESDENGQLVKLEVETFGDEYSVFVNGNKLDFTNSLSLKFKGIGKYTITLDVVDDETKRKSTYVLNIYRGIPVTPNVSDSINSVLKPNQWVIVNGRWRYNDAIGQPLKNTWFFDMNYNSYFYFNGRGNMKTGWINEGGNTYYLGNDGMMRTGWVEYEGKWYYLDMNGVMRTDWVKNNGEWYYLDQDGSMKTGWIVDKEKWYYLNNDGSMETGWILDYKKWYYLSQNGAMKTGWAQYKDDWYYLNNDGSMKSGEWVEYKNKWYYINYSGTMRCGWLYKDDKYYYFNEDGSMRTEPIVLDGYLYNFNEDGSVNFND